MTPRPRPPRIARPLAATAPNTTTRSATSRTPTITNEPSFSEATAKTLEYAYDDFCPARVAEAAGRKADAGEFYAKSLNYSHLFDTSSGFMRGRQADGAVVRTVLSGRMGRPVHRGMLVALDLVRFPRPAEPDQAHGRG